MVIDTILTQPDFSRVHDLGTGPLSGNSLPGTDTADIISRAVWEVVPHPEVLLIPRITTAAPRRHSSYCYLSLGCATA